MIAALYVETNGVYSKRPDIDPWDISRDARRYRGEHAVVAHPPCQRWGRYWGGGPSAKVKLELGSDDGCFEAALASVRHWGGVLEHPEGSHAFRRFELGEPKWREGWARSADGYGWICCVAQGNYGHRSRKLTWLYASTNHHRPMELNWSIPTGLARMDDGCHTSEQRGKLERPANKERLSHVERLSTPEPFAALLIEIARQSHL